MLNGLNSFAGPPDFVVYFTTGRADKIVDHKLNPLKEKDNLYLNDNLYVGKNARVILVCKNGNIIKLKDSGKQNLSDAANQCSKQLQSFTSAYFHFIFDEFTGSSTKIDEKNYLNSLGAISRGWPATNILPDTIIYSNGAIEITWRDRVYSGTVNMFKDSQTSVPLKKINYINNTLRLDSLTGGLKATGSYFWSISNTIGQHSPVYFIQTINRVDYENKVAFILRNVIKTTPAETAYMSAFLLEENHLLVEAAKYYKQAYFLEPGNLIYKNAKLRLHE